MSAEISTTTSEPDPPRRLRLRLECVALFVVAPLSLALWFPVDRMFSALGVFTVIGLGLR